MPAPDRPKPPAGPHHEVEAIAEELWERECAAEVIPCKSGDWPDRVKGAGWYRKCAAELVAFLVDRGWKAPPKTRRPPNRTTALKRARRCLEWAHNRDQHAAYLESVGEHRRAERGRAAAVKLRAQAEAFQAQAKAIDAAAPPRPTPGRP